MDKKYLKIKKIQKKVFLFDKTSANNIIRGEENKFKW